MKNTKILVSVIIANYNNAKFIKDCIKSVKKQTYTNIEIIFFDDCSHDNSLNDENPKGVGEFGLEKTNPIPVYGIDNLPAYMDKLRYEYTSKSE